MSELKAYRVWDAPTRWFHWINAISVVALILVGLLILNRSALEMPRTVGVKLKIVHSWIGYVFAINLLVRLAWTFLGNRFARWRSILPFGRGYFSALASYVKAWFSRRPQQYLGHNPLGRLSVTAMLILITVLAVSGLVLAGTDLFYPPLGSWIAGWVAAPGVEPGTLLPNSPDMYDKAKYDSMRAFRKPFIVSHLYAYYALVVVAGLHVAGVIVTEVREGGNLISATFNGRKILAGDVVDAE